MMISHMNKGIALIKAIECCIKNINLSILAEAKSFVLPIERNTM